MAGHCLIKWRDQKSGARVLLRLLPRRVELDRLRHEIVAHVFKVGSQLASLASKPLAAVSGFDQEFFSCYRLAVRQCEFCRIWA
jgi:hypothetical protein